MSTDRQNYSGITAEVSLLDSRCAGLVNLQSENTTVTTIDFNCGSHTTVNCRLVLHPAV